MYPYDTLRECIASTDHLTDCDEDGYCNFCGYQDSGIYEDEFDDIPEFDGDGRL